MSDDELGENPVPSVTQRSVKGICYDTLSWISVFCFISGENVGNA